MSTRLKWSPRPATRSNAFGQHAPLYAIQAVQLRSAPQSPPVREGEPEPSLQDRLAPAQAWPDPTPASDHGLFQPRQWSGSAVACGTSAQYAKSVRFGQGCRSPGPARCDWTGQCRRIENVEDAARAPEPRRSRPSRVRANPGSPPNRFYRTAQTSKRL